MKAPEAKRKISTIIKRHIRGIDKERADYVADKIFDQVVAVAISDELDRFFYFIYSDSSKFDS